MPATQTLLPVIGITISCERGKSLPITRFIVQLNLGDIALNSTVGPNYVVGYRIQSAAGKVVKQYDPSELSVDKSRINFEFTDSYGYQDFLSSQYGDDANFMGPYKISFIEILDKAQVSYDSANFSLSGTIPLIYKTYTLPYIINDGSYVTDLPPTTTTIIPSSRSDIFPLYSWNNVKQLTIDGQTRNSIYAEINLSYEMKAISVYAQMFYNFNVGVPTGKPGQWGLPGFTSPYSPYMYYGTRTTSFTPGELYTSDYLKIPSLSVGSDLFKGDPTINNISSAWLPTSIYISDVPYTNPTTYKFDSSGIAYNKNLIPGNGFAIPKNWAGYLTFKLIGGGGRSTDKTLFGWQGESVSTPIFYDGTPSLDYKGILVSGGDLLEVNYDSTWGTDTILYVTKGGASSTRTAYRARAGGTSISKTQPNAGATPDGEKISGLAYNSVDPMLRRLQNGTNYYYYGAGWDPTTVAAYSETRIHDISYTIPNTNSSEYSSRLGCYVVTLTPDLELSRQAVTQSTLTWTRDPTIKTFTAPSPNSLAKPAGAQWVTLPYTPSTENIIRLDLKFLIANVDLDKSYFYTNVVDYDRLQSNSMFANTNPVRSSNSFKFKPLYSNFTATIGSVLTNTYTNTSGGIYYSYTKSLTSYDPTTIQTVTIEGVTPMKTLIVGNNPYNMLYSQFPLSFELLAMGGNNVQNRDVEKSYAGSSGAVQIVVLGIQKGATTGEKLTSTSASNILVSPGDIIEYSIGDAKLQQLSFIRVRRNGNVIYNFNANPGATYQCTKRYYGPDTSNLVLDWIASYDFNECSYYDRVTLEKTGLQYYDPPNITFVPGTPYTTTKLAGINYIDGVAAPEYAPLDYRGLPKSMNFTATPGKITFSIDYTIPNYTIPLAPLSLNGNIDYKIYESSVGQTTTFTVPQFLSDNTTYPSQLSYKLIGGGGPGGYYTWISGPMAQNQTSKMTLESTPTGGQGGEYCQGTIPISPGDIVTIVAGKGGYYISDAKYNNSKYGYSNSYVRGDIVTCDGNLVFMSLTTNTSTNPLTDNGTNWVQGKDVGSRLRYGGPSMSVFQVYGQDSYIKIVSQQKKRTSVVYARGGNNTELNTYQASTLYPDVDYSTITGNTRTPGNKTINGTGAMSSLPSGFTTSSGKTTYGGGGNIGSNNSFYTGMDVDYADDKLIKYYPNTDPSKAQFPDTAYIFDFKQNPVKNSPSQKTDNYRTFKDSSSGGDGYYQVKVF